MELGLSRKRKKKCNIINKKKKCLVGHVRANKQFINLLISYKWPNFKCLTFKILFVPTTITRLKCFSICTNQVQSSQNHLIKNTTCFSLEFR